MIGDFSWTAWDYLGEAAIGQDRYRNDKRNMRRKVYPWFMAYDADFDITGFQTPQGVYREIVVDHRKGPYIAVQNPEGYEKEALPISWSWPGFAASWNWPGYEGKSIRVEVYGKGDEAELFCNETLVGRLPLSRESTDEAPAFRAVFDTIYTPGKLEAVLYAGGCETGRYILETAGDDVRICTETENSVIHDNDRELAFVDIWLKDAEGRINMAAPGKVTVTVKGSGVLQGLGSANPCSEENFFDRSCTLWQGHALAVIRPTGTGKIKVCIESGDERAEEEITVVPAADS